MILQADTCLKSKKGKEKKEGREGKSNNKKKRGGWMEATCHVFKKGKASEMTKRCHPHDIFNLGKAPKLF